MRSATAAVTSASVILAGTLLLATGAAAQTTATAGTLTCTGGAGVGLILGSQKSYDCEFKSPSGVSRGSYTATVTKVGLDIGVTGNSVMVWTVLAAQGASVDRKSLAGNYAGAAADASIGIGGGAKALVGGTGQSIILQPLSVQGQTGLNVAVGVAGMTLR